MLQTVEFNSNGRRGQFLQNNTPNAVPKAKALQEMLRHLTSGLVALGARRQTSHERQMLCIQVGLLLALLFQRTQSLFLPRFCQAPESEPQCEPRPQPVDICY